MAGTTDVLERIWKWLSNAELEWELDNLSSHLQFEKVILEFNKLSYIPPLTSYRQFDHLKTLDLFYNFITEVNVANIPRTTEKLELFANKLHQVADFSPLTNLQCLSLSGNRLTYIPPSHIPRSVVFLDLNDNCIQEVGDFSEHECLQALWLRGNPVSMIAGLPVSVGDISIKSNVQVLGRNCFNDAVYKILQKTSIDITIIKFVRNIRKQNLN